jgi:PQQ-dependent catabolism-associated CXXCW motif protein
MRRALLLATLLLITPIWAFASPDEPEGYRLEAYRSATPEGLKGARTVTTEEAALLWRQGSVQFIDVLPATLGSGVHEGKWLPAAPRQDIPGSLWLPNVGQGVIDDRLEAYFRTALKTIPESKPLLFYCLTDCWMSWNAAKRALSWGRAPILWYPAGTDGWTRSNLPLAEASPRPLALQ